MIIWLLLSWCAFAWGRQKARKISGVQRLNSCTSQNMNYANAHQTRDYTKPALGLYLLQFINAAFICVWAVTVPLSVAAFSVKAGILFFFCVTRISSLKQLLLQVRIERLAHTQNINVGVEKEIVGRSQAAPIWPPVTSQLSMLIMEPVNANNTRLRTDIRQERKPPPIQAISSPSASLTLNYNYWALGALCSSCQMWDSGEPSFLSHLCFSLMTLFTCVYLQITDKFIHVFDHFLIAHFFTAFSCISPKAI